MTLDSSQVRVAITGEVSVAPVGTAAPTTSTSALDGAFVGLGYVGEDGVTVTPNETVEAVRAWQNAARVRTLRNEIDWTFQFMLIESKGATAELFFRGEVAVVSAGQWSLTPDTVNPDERAFVLDVIDGSLHQRYYIPRGEVTERGEIVNSNGEPIGYDVTITAYFDDTLGAPFKLFTDDAAWGYS
jgi:hypothetical protein